MSSSAGLMRFPPLVWMYLPMRGISSTCDSTCRPNSRSTCSRSARIGSKICERGGEEFSTATQLKRVPSDHKFRRVSKPIRPEQLVEIRRRLLLDAGDRNVEQLGERGAHPHDMRGFVSLAPERHRRQERAV